jgi:RNA polymerase sigma factor (TIGR02999 family)
MNEVTRILNAIEQGDSHASDELLPLVYDALRRLAAEKMAQESPGQTLQATALVHEVYLRLVDTERAQTWDSRGHFFAAAAEAMRRILVEGARRKNRIKHGGELLRVAADGLEIAIDTSSDDVLSVHESLEQLALVDQQAAQVVKLHFFAGLPLQEVANLLQISIRTVYRDWAFARAWLAKRLGAENSSRRPN